MVRRWVVKLRSSLAVSTLLLAGLVCITLACLVVWQIWSAREDRINDAKTETANLAQSLAQQAQSVFESANVSLLELQERVVNDGIGPEAIARLEGWMRTRVASPPHIHALLLIDEKGNWLANSIPGSKHDLSYGDRDYFRYHRDHDDHRVYIGLPVRGRSDGVWIVTVTRRLNHPDGRFAGVVDATIALSSLQTLYESLDVGQLGVVTLANDAGIVLVRKPFVEANIGRYVGTNDVFRRFVDASDSRSFEYTGQIDVQRRLGSYHRVHGFDLLVIVGRQKTEVLASWRQDAETQLVFLTVTVVITFALAIWLTKQIQKREKAQILYRLLADNASDAVVCTQLNGIRRYVSPAFHEITGWSADDMIGKSWHEIVPTEDHAVLEAAMKDLTAGAARVTSTYRYRKPDESTVWVEMRSCMTKGIPGRPPEFVGNIRDISQKKAIEDQLAKAVAELSALSLSDSLTGIANRRRFDETLTAEWLRARREKTTLALLLVDADHFKNYNDLYGHLHGDDCLRMIAGVLVMSARRPGDLAARYGGEEFAVIVPQTTELAAAFIAQNICRAIADGAIVHEGNEGGVVTVSIGVAAFVPAVKASSELLIETADRALYEAKKHGRNCVRVRSFEVDASDASTSDIKRALV